MSSEKLFFGLAPEYQFQFAEDIGGVLIKNKIIKIPQNLGTGHVFYIRSIPGMAILLWDCNLEKELNIKAYKDNIKRYIFHYDLSDQPNSLLIRNKKVAIGNSINYGLTILNNQTETFFQPVIKQRTFALRFYIDHKLMQIFADNDKNVMQKLKKAKNNFFRDDIDGNSLLLLVSLYEKSIYDESFDSFIKGTGLQLMSCFLKKNSEQSLSPNKLPEFDHKGLLASKEYLENHLQEQFPSITFLSKVAGMSGTKFKMLFKKVFHNTAHDFFIREKMNLAHKMLQSGDYDSLEEIIYELHFNKIKQFFNKYFQIFKKDPSDDFIKNNKK